MLAAAFFLDFMYWQRPAKQIEASPWYEAAAALVRSQLAARAKEAPPVSPCLCFRRRPCSATRAGDSDCMPNKLPCAHMSV